MTKQKTELQRHIDKTSEGEFLYELINSYELSPIVSKNILQTAKSCLFQSGLLQAGQVEYHCVGIDEKSGRQMTEMSKKEVILTLRDEIDDIGILASAGGTALRQNRIRAVYPLIKE